MCWWCDKGKIRLSLLWDSFEASKIFSTVGKMTQEICYHSWYLGCGETLFCSSGCNEHFFLHASFLALSETNFSYCPRSKVQHAPRNGNFEVYFILDYMPWEDLSLTIDCSIHLVFGFPVAEVHMESPMPKEAHGGFHFSLNQVQGYCLITKGSCADVFGFSHTEGGTKAE